MHYDPDLRRLQRVAQILVVASLFAMGWTLWHAQWFVGVTDALAVVVYLFWLHMIESQQHTRNICRAHFQGLDYDADS